MMIVELVANDDDRFTRQLVNVPANGTQGYFFTTQLHEAGFLSSDGKTLLARWRNPFHLLGFLWIANPASQSVGFR